MRTSPWQAALSPVLSSTPGALLPLLAIAAPPVGAGVPVTVAAAAAALAVTSGIGTLVGGAV